MATTDKAASHAKADERETVTKPAVPVKDEPIVGADIAEKDPADIEKTTKKDAIKVKDGENSLFDPHAGQGGAFTINDDGVRVRVV